MGRRYLAMRLAMVVPTVLGMLTAVFFLIRLIPGDPALYMLGDYATPQALAALRAELGTDQPLWVQYGRFMGRALQGDLGRSVVTKQPAVREVLQVLPQSLALATAGMLVAVVLGLTAGVASAVRQDSWVDHFLMGVAFLGVSLPVFWMGLVAILLLAFYLPVFPATGTGPEGQWLGQLYHLALPALVLGFSLAAYVARLTRSAMLEVLRQDFVQVARAKGVGEAVVVWKHVLRNALIPVLAIVGVTFGWALGNSILVEAVFSRSGLGLLIIKAVFARDYQLVQASIAVLALATVLINIGLDVLYAVVDPRVRHA